MSTIKALPLILVAIFGVLFSWPMVTAYEHLSPFGRLGCLFGFWLLLCLGYGWWAWRTR